MGRRGKVPPNYRHFDLALIQPVPPEANQKPDVVGRQTRAEPELCVAWGFSDSGRERKPGCSELLSSEGVKNKPMAKATCDVGAIN